LHVKTFKLFITRHVLGEMVDHVQRAPLILLCLWRTEGRCSGFWRTRHWRLHGGTHRAARARKSVPPVRHSVQRETERYTDTAGGKWVWSEGDPVFL